MFTNQILYTIVFFRDICLIRITKYFIKFTIIDFFHHSIFVKIRNSCYILTEYYNKFPKKKKEKIEQLLLHVGVGVLFRPKSNK